MGTLKTFQLNFITNKPLIRWLQILNEFEKNACCNANDLAILTESTSRTIGKDICQIRDYFEDSITIESTHQGYVFKQLKLVTYEEKKTALLENEPLFLILEKIFFAELYTLDDWSDQLHLSKTTLLKYLKKIQSQLVHFDLDITHDPVNIIGQEADIRHFFCTFFYESEITPHTIFPSVSAQQAVNEISCLYKNDFYRNTSFFLYTYLLYISVERFMQGNTVNVNNHLRCVLTDRMQQVHAEKINDVIEKYYGIRLPEDELIFLFCSIITQRKMSDIIVEKQFCSTYNQWPESKRLAEDFLEILDCSDENKLVNLTFLESFFTTAKLKEYLCISANRNTQDINRFIQKIFPNECRKYQHFLENSSAYHSLYSHDFLVDFTSNLVIYVETIRERYWKNKKNIAFLFEGNNHVIQFIEALSNKYFMEYQYVFYPNASEVNKNYLLKNKIDFLITNHPEHVEEFQEVTECILFRSIPSASDWNRLLEKINPKIINQYFLADKTSFPSSIYE